VKILDCLELYADAAFYDAEFAERTYEIPFYLKRAQPRGGRCSSSRAARGESRCPSQKPEFPSQASISLRQ